MQAGACGPGSRWSKSSARSTRLSCTSSSGRSLRGSSAKKGNDKRNGMLQLYSRKRKVAGLEKACRHLEEEVDGGL